MAVVDGKIRLGSYDPKNAYDTSVMRTNAAHRQRVTLGDPETPEALAQVANGSPAVDTYGVVVRTVGKVGDGLTDTQLRAVPVPVSGTVAASNFTDNGVTNTQLRAASVPVSERPLGGLAATNQGTAWVGGNAITTEVIELGSFAGLLAGGPPEQLILDVYNGTNQALAATTTLELYETFGGAERIVSYTSGTISGSGSSFSINPGATTFRQLLVTAVDGLLSNARLRVVYSVAPTSGQVSARLTPRRAGLPLIGWDYSNNRPQRIKANATGGEVFVVPVPSSSGMVPYNGDGLTATNLLAVGLTGWSGTNNDRIRTNLAVVLLASAVRTTLAAGTTADQTNYNGRYHEVYIEVTAYTSGGLTPKIQGKTPAGTYYDILVGAKITATNTGSPVVLRVGEVLASVANLTAQGRVPRTWRVVCTPDDSASITYSVGASELV
jgi:hypothetical protein